jgi:hypothetical protein
MKRNTLPTFWTVVSGFWFTSAICANQNIKIGSSVGLVVYQLRYDAQKQDMPPYSRSTCHRPSFFTKK